MKNLEIRMLVSEHGLKYKDIARAMKISREWLSKLLKTDLSPANKIRIMDAVEKLLKERK